MSISPFLRSKMQVRLKIDGVFKCSWQGITLQVSHSALCREFVEHSIRSFLVFMKQNVMLIALSSVHSRQFVEGRHIGSENIYCEIHTGGYD